MTDQVQLAPTKVSRKIYLATSWRNEFYPEVLAALIGAGHDVYDFRRPAKGNDGFKWEQVDKDYGQWTPEAYVYRLTSSVIARHGFLLDMDALNWCDTCVLLLPSGRSAHLEAGYAVGAGKDVFVLIPNMKDFQPDLMYLMCHGLFTAGADMLHTLAQMPIGSSPPMGDQGSIYIQMGKLA